MSEPKATDDLDWQHPEVIERTIKAVMQNIEKWRQVHRLGIADNHDAAAIRLALNFAGENADGFQMARFLEDSRLWACDQRLVALLAHTADLRCAAIADIREERNPKPRVIAPEYYPLALRIKDATGRIYQIVRKPEEPGGIYRLSSIDGKFLNATASHELIRDLLEQYGRQ